jgi:hypothetical protein
LVLLNENQPILVRVPDIPEINPKWSSTPRRFKKAEKKPTIDKYDQEIRLLDKEYSVGASA